MHRLRNTYEELEPQCPGDGARERCGHWRARMQQHVETEIFFGVVGSALVLLHVRVTLPSTATRILKGVIFFVAPQGTVALRG